MARASPAARTQRTRAPAGSAPRRFILRPGAPAARAARPHDRRPGDRAGRAPRAGNHARAGYSKPAAWPAARDRRLRARSRGGPCRDPRLAGRRGGEHGVGGLPAASASADRPRVAAKPAIDALALRLQIPAHYLKLYRKAAARYGLDWTRLAAIGAIESGHGQAQAAGVVTGTNADGASGPAQFLAGTWQRFGLDGNGDGQRSPHDPADAIPAMASYLRASGAPQDWRAALRSYNHSDAYVDAVEKLAASLRSNAS